MESKNIITEIIFGTLMTIAAIAINIAMTYLALDYEEFEYVMWAIATLFSTTALTMRMWVRINKNIRS